MNNTHTHTLHTHINTDTRSLAPSVLRSGSGSATALAGSPARPTPGTSWKFAKANNHGTWFDQQAITLSMHVGNASWTKFLAEDAMKRVAVQIGCSFFSSSFFEPDGTMPKELSTRSMHYTWWNMIAFFELAHAIEVATVGVDLFHYTTADNRSLRGALDVVGPYTQATPPGAWPYSEVTPFDHGKFYQIFRMAGIWLGGDYEALISPSLPSNVNYGANIIDLVWPNGATPTIRG